MPQAPASNSRKADEPILLYYDGACPFCSRYVRLLRLQRAVGPVQLIDARKGGALLDELRGAGIKLDQGMALKLGGRFYTGDACIHMLALLSTDSDIFNRLNRLIFRSRPRSKVFYPLLRAARNLVLRISGRARFSQDGF